MMDAAKATGDANYMKYVTDRFNFLAEVAPYFRELQEKNGKVDPQMKQILTPHALDDAGAVCAAMIKAQLQDQSLNLYPLIDNYLDFILNKEYRLADGTFARIRPQYNTLWLDDMFMGVPPVAWYSKLAKDNKPNYLAEATRQIFQFAERMSKVENHKLEDNNMLIDFNKTKEITVPGMNNGTGMMTVKMYMDAQDKIILCAIHKGGGFF